MNDPKSEEIRVLFEQFVQKGFKPKSSRKEMSKQVKEIVELMFENFADVWKVKSKVILEGMEELVTKNLYKILRYYTSHFNSIIDYDVKMSSKTMK